MLSENILMFIAGFLASMCSGLNLYVSRIDDISFNLNDIYLATFANVFMFFLFGVFIGNIPLILISFFVSVILIVLIRRQIFISKEQCLNNIIPYQSTAKFLSERVLENDLEDKEKHIISEVLKSQQKSIEKIKSLL